MPSGYLTTVAIVALYTVLVLRAPRRPVALARVTFLMTHWVNETRATELPRRQRSLGHRLRFGCELCGVTTG